MSRWKRGDSLGRGVDIGCLGVVVELHSIDRGDIFEPMFDGAGNSRRRGESLRTDAPARRAAHTAASTFSTLCSPLSGMLLSGITVSTERIGATRKRICSTFDPRSLAHRILERKPVDLRFANAWRSRGARHCRRSEAEIVFVLLGEDALLGERIILEAAVAVEVIGRDVENDRDLGMELLASFQAGSWRPRAPTRFRRCFLRSAR